MRKQPRLLVLVLLLALLPTSARSGDGEVRLLTDETIPLYLARGRELARNQQWKTMIDVLQRIVTGDPKIFTDLKPEDLNAAVYSDDGKIYYPARELCLKELAAMPPEGLRAYRSIYDARARALFTQAEAETDIEARILGYAEVYDEYLVSSAGDDALERAGGLNLALGRFYEALAQFRRLVEVYPKDTDRDLAVILSKAAYCAARIGDREYRDVLLERVASEYPRKRIKLLGASVLTGDLKDHPAMAVRGGSRVMADDDWPLAGGNPTRARLAEDLPDKMPRRPFWKFKLSQRDPRLEATYGKRWQVAVHDREPTMAPSGKVDQERSAPYPTVRPILYGGLILYKDCLELIGRKVGSGRFVPLRGRYVQPAEGLNDPRYLYPVRDVRPGHFGDDKDKRLSEDIHRFFDYGGNSIVAAGDQFFVVENKSLAYLRSHVAPRPPHNLLVTYHRDTGKTLWAWQGELCSRYVRATRGLWEEWNKDYQAHARPFFRGPGVASGAMLYTVASESGDVDGVSLWAFDLRHGRVRFRTLIHQPDEVAQRLPVGASLAVAGGVVYVATNAGVLAAVDSMPPGRVRWISRYRRSFKQSNFVRRGARKQSRILMNFAYNDPIVVAGKVILAPPDSPSVVAFNAETGRIAWELPRKALGSVNHIVGVSAGVLVMAGSEVTGVDVATGEIVWGPKLLSDAFAYGRGVVSTRYAYIPTMRPRESSAAIYRFDVKTGEPAAPLRFDVKKLGNLLIVGGRLIAANDEEIMCFSTKEHELAVIDKRIALKGATGPLLLERADIAVGAGGSDVQARADFARALRAAITSGTGVRATRLRALAHLFSIAIAREDLGALEEAEAILADAADDKDPLARLRPYEAQAAMLKARILGQLDKAQESLDALEAFLDNNAGVEVKIDGKVFKASTAARKIRTELIFRNRAFQEAFIKTVRARIQRAYEAGDVKTLQELPRRYDNAPPTEESYFALARLHEDRKEPVEAEAILRDLIERFRRSPSVAEAHLRLARLLISNGLLVEARMERNKAVARFDEDQRKRLADLLNEVDKELPTPGQPTVIPRLSLPLSAKPLGVNGSTPVPIEGDTARLPVGLVLVASATSYSALDPTGAVVWTQPNPAGDAVAFGNEQDPETNIVAAAVAAGRFARAVRGDLVIGDVFGLSRINAKTGRIVWQRPRIRADAAKDAKAALVALRADITALKKEDRLHRRHRLATYTVSGNVVVSAHPVRGVEAFGINSGELLWQDTEVQSPVIGAPRALGQLLAVGWAHPGRVRVYGLSDGRLYHEHLVETDPKTRQRGVVLAPPALDSLGRLFILTGRDTSLQPEGKLVIINARSGRPAHTRTFPTHGRYPTILFADGRRVVYHDGRSGGMNLHFVDLAADRIVSRKTGDMLREFEIVRDGGRLFVFTYTLGVSDLGARLFRVDLEGRESLEYDLPPAERAYARPVLTRRYVAIAAAGAASARLRCYDREASHASRHAQKVFKFGEDILMSEFEKRAALAGVRYSVAPAVAVAGRDLIFGTAFGNLRLVGPQPR